MSKILRGRYKMSATLPKQVVISADILVQELEGEAVLLDLESERYYGFDKVGTRMWKLLAENSDVQATFEQLLSEYAVEADVLRKTCRRGLPNCRRRG